MIPAEYLVIGGALTVLIPLVLWWLVWGRQALSSIRRGM
jgi:hypothetical protein